MWTQLTFGVSKVSKLMIFLGNNRTFEVSAIN